MSVIKVNITDSINKFNGILNDLESCTLTLDKSIQDINSANLTPQEGGDRVEKIYKKLRKYKQLAVDTQNTVRYFKSLAEYYYNSHVMTTQYYQGVLNKMMEMKSKMAGMDSQMANIKGQYDNNTEKIQMLETFVELMEKMTKHPMKVDFSIKSKLDDQIMTYDTQAMVDGVLAGKATGKTFVQYGQPVFAQSDEFRGFQLGGAMKSYKDLETIVTESEEKILNSFRDVKFLNDKISELNTRMTKVVRENEELFKIRAEIEWIVNKLEECVGENCDKKSVTENFEKLWSIIKNIQEKAKTSEDLDEGMAGYIQGLEKYVGMLESQVKSSRRTLDGMSKKHMDEKSAFIGPQLSTEKSDSEKVIQQVVDQVNNTSDVPVDQPIDLNVVQEQPGSVVTIEDNAQKDKPLGSPTTVANSSLMVGGKKKRTLKGGSHNELDEFSDANMKSKLQRIYQEKHRSVKINKTIPFTENCSLSIDISDASAELHGKISLVYSMMKNISELIDQVNRSCSGEGTKSIFKSQKIKAGEDDSQQPISFLEMWNETFKHKKTEYYKNLLENKIYDGTGESVTNLSQANKCLLDGSFTLNIRIGFDDDVDNIVNKLEDTFSFLTCAYYVILSYVVSIAILNAGEKSESDVVSKEESDIISKLSDLSESIKNYGKNLQKSSLASFAVYEQAYDEIGNPNMIGGSNGSLPYLIDPALLSSLTQEMLDSVHFTKQEKFLYSKYVEVIKQKPDIQPKNALKEVSDLIMEGIIPFEDVTKDLYELIWSKLGQKGDNYQTYLSKINRQQEDFASKKQPTYDTEITSFEKFIKTIEPTIKIGREAIQDGGKFTNKKTTNIVSIKKFQLGGADIITKPRLDPYREELVKCLDTIKKFAQYFPRLLRLINKNSGKRLSMKETICLTILTKLLEKTIDSGRNNYIKVIPMIFFVVEFPPSIYIPSSEGNYYKFGYKTDTLQLKYTPVQDGHEKTPEMYSGAHAVFFEDNKKNATNYLLTDPLISLGQILKADSEPSKPENKVLNMMFALGASGTGKTTRYFGKEDAPNPLDKEGVVSFIIKNAESTGANSVDLAYFVCYGQIKSIEKNSQQALKPDYGEYMIFFCKPDDTVTDDNLKYMPYWMPNVDAKTLKDYKETKDYTDFYKNLVTKRLGRLEYSRDLKDILNGGENPETFALSVDVGSFRELIESSNEQEKKIWVKLKDANDTQIKDANESKKITDLFENLIGEQKKINTVMATKNNIESSRGHTCVLIRFGYGNNRYRYFPLFDMAGTEDPDGIKSFLKEFDFEGTKYQVIGEKMAKLMRYINIENGTVTDKKKVPNKEGEGEVDEEFAMQSLKDLLDKSDLARKYVLKGYPKQMGGKKIMVSDITQELADATEIDKANESRMTVLTKKSTFDSSKSGKFLEKIIKEGYYINHTIAMLILTSLCVGSSVNTTKVITDDGKETDNFNNLGTDMFQKLQDNMICLVEDTRGLTNFKSKACDNTRLLLEHYSFASILSKSSIWAQILFSFLYWNKESEASALNILGGLNKEEQDFGAQPYIIEMAQQKMDYPKSGLPIEKVCDFEIDGVRTAIEYLKGLRDIGTKFSDPQWIKTDDATAEKKAGIYIKELSYEFIVDLTGDIKIIDTENPVYPLSTEFKYGPKGVTINAKYVGKDERNPLLILIKGITNIGKYIEKMYKLIFDACMAPGNNIVASNDYYTKIQNLSTDENVRQIIAGIFDTNMAPQLIDSDSGSVYFKKVENKQILVSESDARRDIPLVLLIVKNMAPVYPEHIIWETDDGRLKVINSYFKKIRTLINKNTMNKITAEEIRIASTSDPTSKEFQNVKDKFNANMEANIGYLNKYGSKFATMQGKDKAVSSICKLTPSDFDIDKAIDTFEVMQGFLSSPHIDRSVIKASSTSTESQIEVNQMQRIIDGRSSATKMTLMHLVTGQNYKYPMVKNTLELCDLLYSATDLQLGDSQAIDTLGKAVEMFQGL